MTRRLSARLVAVLALHLICVAPSAAHAQSKRYVWAGYARTPQHDALADVAAQSLQRIKWQTPVDLMPQYVGSSLLIHYGSPLATRKNTIVVPVKTGTTGGFQVEGRRGDDGTLLWTHPSDYALPPHDWTPSFGPALGRNKLWIPGAGGTLETRTRVDATTGARVDRVAFYGDDDYAANPSAYAGSVFINTPLTVDKHGNVFFGFQVTGVNPSALESGIARVSNRGVGTWVTAAAASGDPTMTKVPHGSAPAVTRDGKTVYVAVSDGDGWGTGVGYLLALDARTLATRASVRLRDPKTPANDALLHDDGTASPTIGPDGDVYFGVLENPFPSNHARGWLLHFDRDLVPAGPPGAFGWDDTASIVPAALVPSYLGTSEHLLMTKYNNYAGVGGDGVNRIAILDPNAGMTDPISGITVMNEVLTVAGPTPDDDFPGSPTAVREWCINTAVVDPRTGSVLANNEDGILYRWDLATGALSESMVLTAGVGEAYTPTILGPDGTVYAINDAKLFAVGQ
jgi:hypothetical protein